MRLAEKQKVFPAARQSTYYSLKDLISKLPAYNLLASPLKIQRDWTFTRALLRYSMAKGRNIFT